jgi:hypothetical protein
MGGNLVAICFGIGALALFVAAISFVFKGRIGSAIAFGLAAVVLSGIAGAFAAA